MVERIVPAETISGFLADIEEAANVSYSVVSSLTKEYVGPASPFCFNVRGWVRTILSESYPGISYEYSRVRISESSEIEHGYLRARVLFGSPWIIDPTYQQFVDEAERAGLPRVLVVQITVDNHDLVSQLQKHKIPPNYHALWLQA